MRTAIVYYSMCGNTGYIAGRLAERTGADLIQIEPKKAYPDKGASKFIWGGRSAMMSEAPPLKPYEFDGSRYDSIVFGFPVWASRVTPPIRSFINDNRQAIEGKSFAVLVCQAGNGGEKCINRLRELLGIEKFLAAEIFTDPKDHPSEENDKRFDRFCGKLEK